MSGFFDSSIKRNGLQYEILRNDECIGTSYGTAEGSNRQIQLMSTPEILEGDVLLQPKINRRYSVIHSRPVLGFGGNIEGWTVDIESQTAQSTQIINIGPIHGQAVVGSQQNVTLNYGTTIADLRALISSKPTADQPALNELADILAGAKEIKPGMLKRFANQLEKHTDLLAVIGKLILKFATD